MEHQEETLRIEGMSCDHCVATVRETIARMDGVEASDVRMGEARVAFDPARVSRADLSRAIEEEGYTVAA